MTSLLLRLIEVKVDLVQVEFDMSTPARDHLGNRYPSMSAMARAYGLKVSVLVSRLEAGLDIEKALTTPVGTVNPTASKPCVDHLGNKFSSEKKMCEFWHISYCTYRKRIKSRWSLKDALTTQKKQWVDHLGNKYKSCPEMCKHWNMTVSCYNYRVHSMGWSIEKALTTPRSKRNGT